MWKGSKKEDILKLLEELNLKIPPEAKIIDLKSILENSDIYKNDKDFVKDTLCQIIDDRKTGEENSKFDREKFQLEQQNKLEFEKLKLLELEEKNKQLRIEKEFELEQAKLKLQSQTQIQNNNSDSNSHKEPIEYLIKSVKSLTIPVPSKPEIWNLFFSSLERAFKIKEIPDHFKSEILINILGEKANNLLTHIGDENITDYEKVKEIVLREFEPTPQTCLENFRNAKRGDNETHTQFASRLVTNFEYYCKLRKVEDFEGLKNLIVSDHLFGKLDKETATHIGIQQKENWFTPTQLGQECDIYVASKGKIFNETCTSNQITDHSKYVPPHIRNDDSARKNNNHGCYVCGLNNHYAKQCRKRIDNESKTETSENRIKKGLVGTVRCQKDEITSSFCPVKTVKLNIAGVEVESILDSGCEFMTLKESILPQNSLSKGTSKVQLRSAFGERVDAKLLVLPVGIDYGEGLVTRPVNIEIAVCEKLEFPCLLPTDIYDFLVENSTGKKGDGLRETASGTKTNEESEKKILRVGVVCNEVNRVNNGSTESNGLQNVKIKADKPADLRDRVADRKKPYTKCYNRRSSVRKFSVGDRVLLIPDPNDKICSRWTGPAKIIECHPPHIFIVKFQNGTVKQVHVNELKEFHPRVNSIKIMLDDEREFGGMQASYGEEKDPSDDFRNKSDLSHLINDEKRDLGKFSKKHEKISRKKVQAAKVDHRKIKSLSNDEREKPYVYRILDTSMGKANQRRTELLKLNLIDESSAGIVRSIMVQSTETTKGKPPEVSVRTPIHEAAFRKLKTSLRGASPSVCGETCMFQSNASPYGMESCIFQNIEKETCPSSCASQKLRFSDKCD